MVKKIHFSSKESRNSYIVGCLKSRKAVRAVAEEVGLSKKQVRRVFSVYRQNERSERKKGNGRPRALTESQKLQLIATVGTRFGAPLATIVRGLGLPCGVRTAKRCLLKAGFSFKKSQKVPTLSKIRCKLV